MADESLFSEDLFYETGHLMAGQASTVPEMLLERLASQPDADAFMYPAGSGWKTLTWKQSCERIRNVSAGLRALGLASEQRCAIFSATRLDWVVADLGILCAGGATTTIYPSTLPEDCAFILNDSEAKVAFVENEDQLKKLLGLRAQLPHLRQVVLFEGASGHEGWVTTLAELEARGAAAHLQAPEQFELIARAVRPDSLATLIYTSGTTGKPKGVELIHDCWVYTAESIASLGVVGAEDVQLLWLPLAHCFGKVFVAAQLKIGFKTAIDGRVEKLVEHLAVVRPTFVAAVPRIFEKVYNKVVAGAKQGGAVKWAIFRWALSVGHEVSRLKQRGKAPSGLLAVKNALADRLVFSKLRERFGGRLRYFISGSAPISKEISEFFHACGMLVLEGYGLTESSAASFVNRPEKYKFGTVGPPLPGTQIKILPADGEILIKGRGVMRGYHGLPDATAEALDAEGYLHTGDIGELVDGCLKITDRKKDLIKTSVGKYVAPQVLEIKLKTLCPVISQVLIHGNNRNYCSALVALDEEGLRGWAQGNGLGALGYAQWVQHEKTKAMIQGCVQQLNSSLAGHEQVKKWAILPQDLTLDSGDLTPSLKVKRKVVEQKYRALLDGFYAGNLAEV